MEIILKTSLQLLKTTVSNSKFDMIKKRTSCEVQGPRVDKKIIKKICKVARVVNFMFLRKLKKKKMRYQIEGFFFLFVLCVSSVFIIFHSHFWLSSEQQSSRGHRSVRRQISIKLYLCHLGEIKMRHFIDLSEKLFNLELSSQSFHLWHIR